MNYRSRLFYLVVFILLVASTASCGGVSVEEYTISVSGTAGQPFNGSYMGVDSGSTNSKSIEGVVPATYTISGSIVSCMFQKTTDNNNLLKAQISKKGKVVAETETTAAYGVVTLSTSK